jgi:hypothetical protein
MKSVLKLLFLFILITSCGAKKSKITSAGATHATKASHHTPFFDISEYSKDKDYGLSGDNPVKVGEKSVKNQLRYLASLAGPNGEELNYHRRGACCGYKSKNGYDSVALVDVYEVTYEGLKKPILVYISFYDFETLYLPQGFIKRSL